MKSQHASRYHLEHETKVILHVINMYHINEIVSYDYSLFPGFHGGSYGSCPKHDIHDSYLFCWENLVTWVNLLLGKLKRRLSSFLRRLLVR